jgi:hypothetical protein
MAARNRLAFIGLIGLAVGCSSAGGDPSQFDPNAGNGGSGAGGPSDGGLVLDTSLGNGDGGILTVEPSCQNNDPGADSDKDGWTVGDGDCNDCTVQMNPGAYDYPGNNIDEDCNGGKDDEPAGCDKGLPLDGNNPMDAAKSIGLCKFTQAGATGKNKIWGVISAKYVFADGSTQSGPPNNVFGGTCTGQGGKGAPPNPMSHGLLPKFGNVVKPREGASMLALSAGVAREGRVGDSPAEAVMCTESKTPDGFPTPSKAACPNTQIDDKPVANDPIALELEIRAPSNARSFWFDFDFYTFEYPIYICTKYNDFFVALLWSKHTSVPPNHNISFDAKNNPVSVNNGFLEVCKAGTHGGKQFACALGTAELGGTGYDDKDASGPHAATGWLQTQSPVVPGEEIKLRFAIWDMGDEILDSTVLIDKFRWDVEEGTTQTTRPPVK